MIRRSLIIILISLMTGMGLASVSPGLYPGEAELLVEMLTSAGFDSTSLAFEKDWDLSTKYKSHNQLSQLQDPWKAFPYIDSLRAVCSADVTLETRTAALLEIDSESSLIAPDQLREIKSYYAGLWNKSVHKPAQVFAYWERVYRDLSVRLGAIGNDLSPADRDSLIAFHLLSNSEGEDNAAYKEYIKELGLPLPADPSPLGFSPLLDRIDIAGHYDAALVFIAAYEVMLEGIDKVRFAEKGISYHDSPYGTMIIGSYANDRYTKGKDPRRNQPCLVIDPGGDDIYELEFRSSTKQAFFLTLDLKGDDIYRNERIGGLFSVMGGLGIGMDLAGNDTYLGGDMSFSAFSGVNIHVDSAGDDIYKGGSFCQGSAFFGASLLIDEDGDDQYIAATTSQGFGCTRGFGGIIELGGSDRYLLGAKYTHAPLMPNDYRSMGQGMGFGYRSDFAGGTGMIYDRSGNDKYIGGVYAQGVGYWFATGILIDEKGNDVYNAVYYPQGSGIHLANGYLYDGEGDDAYYTRNGPGQGAGHDWALGILLDKSGDDAYSIPGGNGLGLNNSVGIFVDSKGNDRYERQNPSSYGFGSFSRSAGSLGLFLDTSGKDTYPDSLFANNKTWQRGSYGFGRDLDLYQETQTAVEALAESAALVDSLAPISEVFSAASEWEVGSAVKRVRAARELMIKRQAEAIDYILANKLDSDSGLEFRALEELIDNSVDFKTRLFPYITGEDSLKAKNAMSLIAGTGDSLLIDPLLQLLSAKKYITACLSCLGWVKSAEAVRVLSEYIDHPSERYRYITARSLSYLKMPEAFALLKEMQDDRSFLVQSLLCSIPELKQ